MTNPEITGITTLDCPDCGTEVHWGSLRLHRVEQHIESPETWTDGE
jgi:hypothetical protein